MTLEDFQSLRALQDHRVCLDFNDGQVVIATLLSITIDLDASCHVVYDNVEWSALPLSHPRDKNASWYASGEEDRLQLTTTVEEQGFHLPDDGRTNPDLRSSICSVLPHSLQQPGNVDLGRFRRHCLREVLVGVS
jgi:hypothetical protein